MTITTNQQTNQQTRNCHVVSVDVVVDFIGMKPTNQQNQQTNKQ